MTAALHRREFLAACAVGVTGALAGCADPDVAMFVEGVDGGTDRSSTTRPVHCHC